MLSFSEHPADLYQEPYAFLNLVRTFVVPGEPYYCDVIEADQPLRLTHILTGVYSIINRPGIKSFTPRPDMRLGRNLPARLVRVKHENRFVQCWINLEEFQTWLVGNQGMFIHFSVDGEGKINYFYRAPQSHMLTIMRMQQHKSAQTMEDLELDMVRWGYDFAMTDRRQFRSGS